MNLAEFRKFAARHDLGDAGTWRRDAALSYFVEEQLQHVASRVYEKEYPEFKYRDVLPINTEIPPGAEAYAFDQENVVGEALVTDSYAADSPAIDAFLERESHRIVPIRDHYTYSVQDMRAALMAGRNLPDRKAVAARSAIERKIDEVMAKGDSARGITGLINNASVPSANAASNGTGTTWAVKTPDERNNDIISAMATTFEATKGLEGLSVDVLLPNTQYMLLLQRITDLNMTGLAYLKAAVENVRSVKPYYWLDSANSGLGTDRMILYVNEAEKLEGLLPLPLYQHTPEQRGMTWKTELEARCGGVVFYKPLSARYVDAI